MSRRSYQPCAAKLRNDTGALTHDVAGPGHLPAGEPGQGPASARCPVPAGFSWSLAAAAAAPAIAPVAITAADGDLLMISLVPGSLAAALTGGLMAMRRHCHPAGTPRTPGERPGPDDEPLLAGLARQAAPAAHAAALGQAPDASRAGQDTAREEERRRLRRDLHDGVGPTLAGLTLGLDTARAMSAGHPGLDELLTRLKAESQRAVTDIRRIIYGLRPPALDELGLAAALREEVTRLKQQAPGLSITLHLPARGLDGLPAAAEVAAYRIITEAVTNVLRHARARRCQISVRSGQDLRLEVCDDGTGLPEGWRAGVGITAMRERAAELGGQLAVQPGRPRGTRITARLPAGRAGQSGQGCAASALSSGARTGEPDVPGWGAPQPDGQPPS